MLLLLLSVLPYKLYSVLVLAMKDASIGMSIIKKWISKGKKRKQRKTKKKSRRMLYN
jgi:hypothetical protein